MSKSVKAFYVKQLETCGACEATGYIDSEQKPLWDLFNKKFEREPGIEEATEEFSPVELSWWEEKRYFARSDGSGLPKADQPCRVCHGEGAIESFVELADAMAHLNKPAEPVKLASVATTAKTATPALKPVTKQA